MVLKPAVKKFVKFIEDLSIIKLFFCTILIPTGMVIINIGLMEHKGTTYRVTHEVFFDITVAGEPNGQIVIGLFGETVPKTVQNFYTLATSGIGDHKYEGTIFHRVIEKFMIQGGDVFHQDGMGRISIYGETFPDENFIVKHATLGFLAMANSGPDSNACQFYITTVATPWLDDKHVVFGKVVEGQRIVHQIEHLQTDANNRPLKEVRIAKSGARKVKNTYSISDDPYNIWDWLKTISVPLGISFSIILVFNYFIKQIDKGIKAEDTLKRLRKEENLKNSQEKETLLKAAKQESVGTLNDSDAETDLRRRQKSSSK